MSETPESEPSVLGALPHSRSHRRSDKRAARPAAEPTPAEAELQHDDTGEQHDDTGEQHDDTGEQHDDTGEQHEDGAEDFDLLRTAVQAVGELTEIGLTLGARLLRSAISHLPRP